MKQYGLYTDGIPPHVEGSKTSQEAAKSVLPQVGTLQREVLDYLRKTCHGATDEEIQIALKMRANTERPRRRELELQGLVKDSGETRPTSSGRQAVVWVINDSQPLLETLS